MLAAVGLAWSDYVPRPTWGCTVYLTVESTRTLVLDDHQLNFGYQVLTPDPGDGPGALAERMDHLLVACRRQAKFLAGHDFVVDLQRLATVGGRLRGVDGVRQQWTDRADKGRGMARMIDTAHDGDFPGPAALAAVCEHADLKVAVGVHADADPGNDGVAATVRRALTRILAVALIAARSTGRYRWASPIDVDQLVTDAAWDRLAELGESPPVS
ncbi:hypothetical protein BLA60_12920 [Actinophytocola xinjiangensis]|uniref:Uncharacterized protein n=2 Tax=Actinophytocola xinjiangensis TaxID=485602 RepID=A0A7Z0WN15_9PSEU|nr:hypothetical protein BLA60_12920 [Actinophytocola xinjiangensis]